MNAHRCGPNTQASTDSLPQNEVTEMDQQPVDPRMLSVGQRVAILVKALDGARRTNEALAKCANGDEMVEVLLAASAKLRLGLTRAELMRTPPIRDWLWWKNKEALLTIGDARPRYQQDGDQGRPRPASDAAEAPPRRKFLGLF
jgi:hypothetical protein